MIPELFLSHRLDELVDLLLEQLDAAPVGPLETRTILVANGQMKQWLLLEIAKRKGIAMGLKIVTIDEGLFPKNGNLEIFCQIYDCIKKSTDSDLLAYLDGKKGRLLNLTEEIFSLFLTYGQFGKHLFDPECKTIDWQHAILQELFVKGPWRMPVQLLSESKPVSLHCFGVDYLPPLFWDFLFRAPSLLIYLFSPCVDFWTDLCSERERRSLNRYWKKRKASEESRKQLDLYLREGPSMLANWGKLGRETLKVLDRFDLQMEEAYPSLEPDSLLKKVQTDLLLFQRSESGSPDDSIRIFMTGSSRLKEIECLRDEILRLNIPYHEISVLAPTIEPYVPLIEFVFSEIPYRISGFDIASQSSFRQGLARLIDLGRWDAEKILTLFETPAFYRKRGWDPEKLELFRSWVESQHIKWGIDQNHRNQVLTETFGEKKYQAKGSWEEGLDRLLEALVFFRPFQVQADHFEEFISIITALKAVSWGGEKPLSLWADSLEKLAEEFLRPDLSDEADVAAYNAFRQFIHELRSACTQERHYPFQMIQKLLLRPCSGQIHPSHLHAIRFSPLEEGALLPSKALFLIGMDEESFPRMKIGSSLDLLKGEAPLPSDKDRYLFLQTIFSAQEYLRISFGHLSQEEGKPVGPSLLVQELMTALCLSGTVYHSSSPLFSKLSLWPRFTRSELPSGEVVLSVSDLKLLARHPWKFFLQKVRGMYLNEPLEDTFVLQKGLLLRATLEKPIDQVLADADLPTGPLGDALKSEIMDQAQEWQNQLAEWQLHPFSLILRENCTERHWEGTNWIVPPLELTLEKRLKVRIVGEIKQATEKGLICANEDKISGLLKVWPEALITACIFNAPGVWMLRNGKPKKLPNPEENLHSFVSYYFQCLSAPSPLLSDWADAILRKGAEELEKIVQKGTAFEDPVIEWVLARNELPSAAAMIEEWGPFLKSTFADLAGLYPSKGKNHAAV